MKRRKMSRADFAVPEHASFASDVNILLSSFHLINVKSDGGEKRFRWHNEHGRLRKVPGDAWNAANV